MLFEPQKGPLWVKKGIFTQNREPKTGRLAGKKAHISLKLVSTHRGALNWELGTFALFHANFKFYIFLLLHWCHLQPSEILQGSLDIFKPLRNCTKLLLRGFLKFMSLKREFVSLKHETGIIEVEVWHHITSSSRIESLKVSYDLCRIGPNV